MLSEIVSFWPYYIKVSKSYWFKYLYLYDMLIDIFKGLFFSLTRGKSVYKRMKTLWKRSSDKTLFTRFNAEQSLNVNKINSKEENVSVSSFSKNTSFWFHAFMTIPGSQINQSLISRQTVTSCHFKICKYGKFRADKIHSGNRLFL